MFNEEKNIANCIKTLMSQTDQHFHAVFIDDGSKDNTIDTLNALLTQKNCLFQYTIIQQENSGAAKAREHGILSCKTEYVMILDCDDLISTDTIEKTQVIINDKAPDIILPNVQVQQGSGHYHEFRYFNNEKEYVGLECVENSLGGWKVHGWMCAKKNIFLKSYSVYKKYNPTNANYINNDEIIVRLNFFFAHTIIKSTGTYFYQNNLNSTTKSINPNRYLMCKNAIILCKFFSEKNIGAITNKSYKELINVLWGTVKYAKRHKNELYNINQWLETIKEVLLFIKSNKIQRTLDFKSKLRFFHAKLMAYFL